MFKSEILAGNCNTILLSFIYTSVNLALGTKIVLYGFKFSSQLKCITSVVHLCHKTTLKIGSLFTWCDGVELSVVVESGVWETSANGESAAELLSDGHDVDSRSPARHEDKPLSDRSAPLRDAAVVVEAAAAAFSMRRIWMRSWIWASWSKLSSEKRQCYKTVY
jgi:hypothetical protein